MVTFFLLFLCNASCLQLMGVWLNPLKPPWLWAVLCVEEIISQHR